jgi:hypothetical protein
MLIFDRSVLEVSRVCRTEPAVLGLDVLPGIVDTVEAVLHDPGIGTACVEQYKLRDKAEQDVDPVLRAVSGCWRDVLVPATPELSLMYS